MRRSPAALDLPLFTLLGAAQFVVLLDAWIVNMAIPAIARDFSLPPDELSWVTNAYLLPFGGLLLLGGRLADTVGPRRMFAIGTAVFGLGSLAGGLAPDATALVCARAVQGAGAALVSPAALAALVALTDDGAQRARALALWGAVAAAGAPLGALLGGLLTDLFGWSAVLLVNVPVCVAVVVLAPALLPPMRREHGRGYDAIGALTVTAGAALLLYALLQVGTPDWQPSRTLTVLVIAVALLALFAAVERRTPDPIVPRSVFRVRSVRSANVVVALLQMAQYGAFFFVALVLQELFGLDPLAAGLAFVPYGAIVVPGAAVAARVIGRFGARAVVAGGSGLLGCGTLWLLAALGGRSVGWLLPGTLLLGFGGGLAFVAINVVGLNDVGAADGGLVSGLISTSMTLGGAVGLAVSVTAYSMVGSGLDDGVAGTRIVFALQTLLAFASALLALVSMPERASSLREE